MPDMTMPDNKSEEQPIDEAPAAKEPKPAPVDDVVGESDDTPRVESPTEAKAIVEALLFTTNSSMSAKRLASMIPGWTPKQLEEMILELRDDLDDQGRGMMLQEVAGGWLMCTRPRFAEWVFSLHRNKRRNPLTPQALETLAIIAYKQPITRADIEVIRGVDAGGMLRNLLDLEMVTIAGYRESVGRPPLYGTTDMFLRTFGLKSVSDLPTIDELKALIPQAPEPQPEEEQQEELPLEEDTMEEKKSDEIAPVPEEELESGDEEDFSPNVSVFDSDENDEDEDEDEDEEEVVDDDDDDDDDDDEDDKD